MKILILCGLSLLSIAGCDRGDGPPMEITEATVFAPLPGTRTTVAYLTIRNHTARDIVINSIHSPQFGSAMLHETQIVDGVARMTRLATLLIPAKSTLVLGGDGRHIMLMNPVQALQVKQPVTLQIEYDADGLVIVNTTLQSRLDNDSTH